MIATDSPTLQGTRLLRPSETPTYWGQETQISGTTSLQIYSQGRVERFPLPITHIFTTNYGEDALGTNDGGAALAGSFYYRLGQFTLQVLTLLILIQLTSRRKRSSVIKSLLGSNEQAAIGGVISPHLDAFLWIKAVTGLSDERIGRLIGVSRQAINLWKKGEPINDTHRQRLFVVRDILERAASKYPSPAQLAAWLDTPRGAEGVTPAQLLEKGELAQVLAQAQQEWTELRLHAPGFRDTADFNEVDAAEMRRFIEHPPTKKRVRRAVREDDNLTLY